MVEIMQPNEEGVLSLNNLTGDVVLVAGSNITLTPSGQNITITSTASGTGDVVGPASAVDSNFASFNTTTGKLIKDSGYSPSSFVPYTGATGEVNLGIYEIMSSGLKANSSAGVHIHNTIGGDIALFGAGGGLGATFYDGVILDANTANTVAIFGATKNLISADTATYPSLTELSYVKGLSSAVQTQLNGKQATITFGTGVQTALGVNIGSAGAPVLFNGALGTPSSGTGTNITGIPAANILAGTFGTGAYVMDTSLAIGTTSASGLLHVATSTTALGLTIFEQASTDTDSYDLSIRKARGTIASPTTIVTGDELGAIMFRGYATTNGYITNGGASIKALSTGTINSTRIPSILTFSTSTNATPSVLTEAMRIQENQRVIIGGEGAITAVAPLHVYGTGFPVFNVERATSATASINSTFRLLSTTSADMADGFGGGMVFSQKDNAGVINDNARIASIRDGGDAWSGLVFDTGTLNRTMTMTAFGNVGIGTSTPTAMFHMARSTASGRGSVSTTASGTTVTGVLTQFQNTFLVGDTITINGETRTISAIASNTSMTTDAWTADNTLQTYTTTSRNILFVRANGSIGIGSTAPTALLHIKAGTATAGTAPLKFTSGTLLTTPEAGAIEFLTDAYYATITTGAARKTFAFLESPVFTTPNIGVATATSVSCSPTISSGTAAPATTPAKVGDIFVDTTNKKMYIATGTSSSADWTITN